MHNLGERELMRMTFPNNKSWIFVTLFIDGAILFLKNPKDLNHLVQKHMIQLSIVKHYFGLFCLVSLTFCLFLFCNVQCAFITVPPFTLETRIGDIGRVL